MKLFRMFLIELPCMVLIAFPVAAVSYLRHWAVAGWYCGDLLWEINKDDGRTWKVKIDIPGAGNGSG